MVREVIEDAACAVHPVAAGHALTVKENVFALGGSGEIGFGDDSGCHGPVELNANLCDIYTTEDR
jgi:hypothetical protein